MEQVLDTFQNMHSLLEPEGEILVIGTRWDYTDLYSTILYKPEFNSEFSVFICTAIGKDGKVFFPQKFDTETLRKLEGTLLTYKFSCQYMNQPVDQERAEFQSSWLK